MINAYQPMDDTSSAEDRAPGQTSPDAAGRSGKRRVLVIDPAVAISLALKAALEGADFAMEWASTAAQGQELVESWCPDVVILDLNLPDMDGLDICRHLRTWSSVPIIVLSARTSEQDKITALELGADDYLTKPFSLGELLARVRVALRHAAYVPGRSGTLSHAQQRGLVLDFEHRQVRRDGVEVHLTPTEYAILKYLAMHPDKIVTHRTLLHAIGRSQEEENASYLRVYVAQLRRKIEPDPSHPRYLLTEPWMGYRFLNPDR